MDRGEAPHPRLATLRSEPHDFITMITYYMTSCRLALSVRTFCNGFPATRQQYLSRIVPQNNYCLLHRTRKKSTHGLGSETIVLPFDEGLLKISCLKCDDLSIKVQAEEAVL